MAVHTNDPIKDEFLTSKKEIMTRLGISEHIFWNYIEEGMPALYNHRTHRWSASLKAIMDWWYRSRNISMQNLISRIRADEATSGPFEEPAP